MPSERARQGDMFRLFSKMKILTKYCPGKGRARGNVQIVFKKKKL